MFKTIVTATVITMALAGVAEAKKAKMMAPAAGAATRGADAQGQFYATPNQKGAPTDLPGERLIPGASQAAMVIDGVVGPIVPVTQQVGAGVGQTVGGVIDPIGGAIGGPVVAAGGPAPAAKMRHHRRGHHMMKRKMMKKM